MAKTKELDLRQLPPFERHERIFSTLEGLSNGESLRITNDHDPKPLSYQLEIEYKGQFKFNYEKNGPESWVIKITKNSPINKNIRKEEIKEVLKKLQKQDSEEIKGKAKEILKNLSPTKLASIEQEIIKEGTTKEEMKKLCDVHLEIMKENFHEVNMDLKPGHPIHTLMEEHKIILDFTKRLEEALKKMNSHNNFEEANAEIETLRFIAEHLFEADKHHKREEKALFPEIKRAGMTEPPNMMEEEHKDIISMKKELYAILQKHKRIPYQNFIKNIGRIAGSLKKELSSHIYKENNILYPMAVQIMPKEKWRQIKNKCDKIGYCCFTPKY